MSNMTTESSPAVEATAGAPTPTPSAACRVAGVIDNTLYEVVLTGNKRRPVVGSKRIAALIAQATGSTVTVTPAGPAYQVDPTDITSLVALLSSATQVRRLEAAPDLGARSPVDGVR